MEKLCKDQLVGRLVALFKETDQSNIDDAVAQAKGYLTAEAKQAREADLEKLFASQIATLMDRGVPEQIVEILQNQKGSVLKKASEMAIGDGNIPFLPVIPRSFRSPYDLMAMVRNGREAGCVYLSPTTTFDVVDAPDEPYYIYDVENGNATRGKSPENAEKTFKQQNRSGLTAAEVMALAIHTDVLSKHNVWAPGSRCESVVVVRVPFVLLDISNRPGLLEHCITNSDDHRGSASCGSR